MKLYKTGEIKMPGNIFPNRVLRKWNKLPVDIVYAKNMHIFKKKYDKVTKNYGIPQV